jgi:hypothetical protein
MERMIQCTHLLVHGILDGWFEGQNKVRTPTRPQTSDALLPNDGRDGIRCVVVAPGLYSHVHALYGYGCAKMREFGNVAGWNDPCRSSAQQARVRAGCVCVRRMRACEGCVCACVKCERARGGTSKVHIC